MTGEKGLPLSFRFKSWLFDLFPKNYREWPHYNWFLAGLQQACWVWICGDRFIPSIRHGLIYWGWKPRPPAGPPLG